MQFGTVGAAILRDKEGPVVDHLGPRATRAHHVQFLSRPQAGCQCLWDIGCVAHVNVVSRGSVVHESCFVAPSVCVPRRHEMAG